MQAYTQTQRPLAVSTPLGADKLLLVGLSGSEGLSQLFHFDLDLVAVNGTDVAFDKLLGQPIVTQMSMPQGTRYFHGICVAVRQTGADETFTGYQLEIVPNLWLWTKRTQSRIFQHENLPDILKAVLKGLDVAFDLKGTFQPRDYCVQYRESDYDFAHRLMAEEGIYFYFKHTDKGHRMVVANTPQSHADLPANSTLIYKSVHDRLEDDEEVVREWRKRQTLRSGKVTLWDHSFELPHQHLDAEKTIEDSVQVGQVTHKLKVANNDKLELYDYPGAYAQRFDGVPPGGGDKAADLQHIFSDNGRTTAIRMQEEALHSILIDAESNCAQVTAGHKFTLAQPPGNELTRLAKADGHYVVTAVTHKASVNSNYRSGDWGGHEYANEFQCIPFALPYRPPQETPKPVVPGSQTAVVVGPAGEEIFTDKYGRVKVQFHWDRHGKQNADSSCWVRVATLWAGKQWGVIHIPRIGQEVVVDFLEGDPDRPIIVGSVYNAETMPPYALPANKTQSGVKSRSSMGGNPETFNEICFEDKKGSELIYIRAEKDQTIAVENDEAHWVGNDRMKTIDHDETTLVHHDRTETVDHDETITIGHDRNEHVKNDETLAIDGNRTKTVQKDESSTINGSRTETVTKDESITINGGRTETVQKDEALTINGGRTKTVAKDESSTINGGRTESVAKDESLSIAGGRTETVGKDESVSVAGGRTVSIGKDDVLTVGKTLSITAADSITLTTGDASIVMQKDGTITIQGKNITVQDSGATTVKTDKTITMKGQKILQN